MNFGYKELTVVCGLSMRETGLYWAFQCTEDGNFLFFGLPIHVPNKVFILLNHAIANHHDISVLYTWTYKNGREEINTNEEILEEIRSPKFSVSIIDPLTNEPVLYAKARLSNIFDDISATGTLSNVLEEFFLKAFEMEYPDFVKYFSFGSSKLLYTYLSEGIDTLNIRDARKLVRETKEYGLRTFFLCCLKFFNKAYMVTSNEYRDVFENEDTAVSKNICDELERPRHDFCELLGGEGSTGIASLTDAFKSFMYTVLLQGRLAEIINKTENSELVVHLLSAKTSDEIFEILKNKKVLLCNAETGHFITKIRSKKSVLEENELHFSDGYIGESFLGLIPMEAYVGYDHEQFLTFVTWHNEILC